MDQYLSTVVVAVITGIFSIITLFIQRKQDRVIKKIDEQTVFINQEKAIKAKIDEKEKEREAIVHETVILILDTNLQILANTQTADGTPSVDSSIMEICNGLKTKFNSVTSDLEKLHREYEVILNMTSEFKDELSKLKRGSGG